MGYDYDYYYNDDYYDYYPYSWYDYKRPRKRSKFQRRKSYYMLDRNDYMDILQGYVRPKKQHERSMYNHIENIFRSMLFNITIIQK